MAAFASFFAGTGGGLAGAEELRRLAERRLSEQAFWTGVAQVCRGRRDTGQALLSWAFQLTPSLRYLPPVRQLARMRNPQRHAAEVLSALVGRLAHTGTPRTGTP